ncbi:MAG: NHL repeat-containing protein [Gaiellaceae bacterium]
MQQRQRRRQRLALAALALLATAIVGGAWLNAGGGTHHAAGPLASAVHARKGAVAVQPPPPLPGYLLIADRGNARLLLVDGRKRILWRYPSAGRTPGMAFRFDDDAFFTPGFHRIISNQEDQHTIQIITFPQGRLVWDFGHVNKIGSANGYLHTPDDAYLLPNGIRTVADAYNCRVLFIRQNGTIARMLGTTGVCRHNPPREIGPPNGATPLADGGTLVSEITGSWIDSFDSAGRLRWSFRAPVSYPSDPQPLPHGRIMLADYARPGHVLIVDRHGHVLWRYGPASGPGALDHPSLALPLGHGLVAVNDDYRDRVVVINIRRKEIVWQYGHTDSPGTGPGYLNTPDGMDLLPTAVAARSAAVQALARNAH